MKSILPLILLCACSAWADVINWVPRGTNIIEQPSCSVDIINRQVKLAYSDGRVLIFPIERFTLNGDDLPMNAVPGGHTNFIPATPDTAMKVMALRRSSVEPPMPPHTGVTSVAVEGATIVSPGYFTNQLRLFPTMSTVAIESGAVTNFDFTVAQPRKPRPHPNIPDHSEHPSKEKERARIAAMLSEKAKAVQSGILYPYEVKELNNFFDTPDDWTGWLIQRRGPKDDHWSECGQSETGATKGSTVAGTAGYQYRLLRTAP